MPYPVEIDENELIVRVVRSPYHLNKSESRLTPSAFRPPPGRRDLSVIRWRYTIPDGRELKTKIRSIGNCAEARYKGLAALIASECLAANVELVDSREQFLGHADILMPYAVPNHEPADGSIADTLAAIRAALRDAAKYHPDPAPEAQLWTIDELPPPCDQSPIRSI
ncbi:hypothetical protein QFW77_18410 [Luteimonas sp. RD2P54]|uniref:Uncharacterized protein n=1 Tax=Luteimonas endophytica TaxID=3042023 RepID=A0ABT6JDP2_9GAMM|nr:hypothetical protein [Luteimonas endophytica]MDH5824943.1 hypothetical protein [Luteimonas endophytica]